MWHSRNGDVCLKRQSCTRLVQLTCFKRLNFVFEGKSLHSSLCCIFHSFTTGLRVAGQLLQTSLSLPFKKHLQQYARDQSNYNNILPTIVEEYTLPRGYWLICKPMWLGLQQLIIQQLPSASSNQSKLVREYLFFPHDPLLPDGYGPVTRLLWLGLYPLDPTLSPSCHMFKIADKLTQSV